MDINEILKTKLEQTIDTFNQSDKKIIEKNIAAIAENNKKLDKLSDDIHELKIPEEVNVSHFHEHKHLNAGVRFMLIVVITVILTASILCWYWHSKYEAYKQFSENYDRYQKNMQWCNDFLQYMYQKNPKDTKAYLKGAPPPKE